MIYAQTRVTKDSIAFIERTYRKSDSKYADFSIRQQQHILQKLSGEWTRSECTEPLQTVEKKAWLSPPPRASIEPRWGFRKCEAIRGEIRATKNSMAFIERTYRKSDPAYADFSIRQQQQILQKLNEEWSRSECTEQPPIPERKVRK
jgi:hypothetical protein